ncbi:MAG: heavy metal translocating P-type ATPase, partial [Candidatus Dormibacteraeota bacterium]|nr:heavy metal translocating P-type ATPase [Candidatus Dormibacteraeota bacterium]
HAPRAGRAVWAAGTILVLIVVAYRIVRELLRRQVGVDLIALLAMAGSLVLGQELAGIVISLMLAGGQLLEWYAGERARRELSTLVQNAPRTARRLDPGGVPVTVPVDAVRAGDRLMVAPGEVVPVDGALQAPATLDEAPLTGEPLPVTRLPGDEVRSGVVNVGAMLEMTATATADASTYATIVRVTQQAAASAAPLVRLADRFAIVFLPVTLAIAGGAWAWSGSPVRALAVLVVATPCPLILAAPIAIVAGISRAAKRGIVVKGGGVLEQLAQARVVVFDKTGTLTWGRPRVGSVVPLGAFSVPEVLRYAASVEQASTHPLAAAIVDDAHERGVSLAAPAGVEESPGEGVEGLVEGRAVRVGQARWVLSDGEAPGVLRMERRAAANGDQLALVTVDGALAGVLQMEDRLRLDAPAAVRLLRRQGVRRVVLATGDNARNAERIGQAIGADQVHAGLVPTDKLAAIRAERAQGVTVMVGDGVNDAPALAAADVGIAMGARGTTASSEAAGAVITVERLARVAEALAIARRSRRIALESIVAGMGLSVAAMLVATTGVLPPVFGALVQEGIDVAVIVNALRALRPGPGGVPRPEDQELVTGVTRDHEAVQAGLETLLAVADGLGLASPGESLTGLHQVQEFLVGTVVPHEAWDEARLLPAVDRRIGGDDPTE